MTTNLELYEARHRRLCESAEEAFALEQTVDAKFSVSKAVALHAREARRDIRRRDTIASCYASARTDSVIAACSPQMGNLLGT